MSQSTGDALPPQSPKTWPTQPGVDVSTSWLADHHPYILPSRKSPQSDLSNTVTSEDSLGSLFSSRSGADRPRRVAGKETNLLRWTSSASDEFGNKSVKHTPEGEVAPTRKKYHGLTAEAVSADHPQLDQTVNLLSESPKSFASSSASVRPPNSMPRTSSIDSAISNISTPSHAQRPPGDARDPSRDEVHNLIATAGSAENLILHLLRDKSHAASQNAQLWKLVDKQRALLLGLNKDLERMTKERDRYRKKAKDFQPQPSTEQIDRLRPHDGQSPQSDRDVSVASKEHDSLTGLDATPKAVQQTPSKSDIATINQMESSPIDPAMMPMPLHLQAPQRGLSLSTQLAPPIFSVIEATPLSEKPPKSFQASRKAPPKPLDLSQAKDEASTHMLVAPTEIAVDDTDEEEPSQPLGRGRRKTREEDDRDRELLALKEQETRRRSKKEKKAKPEAETTLDPMPFPDPPSNLPTQVHEQQQAQDHLSPPSTASGQNSLPLRSPGLPMSPRPMASALMGASLPMSPRAPGGNFPLSPRAPKLPLPMPTTPGQQAPAPQAQAAPTRDNQKKMVFSPLGKVNTTNTVTTDSDRSLIHESPLSPSEVPPVDRSLVDPSWPDFLLPPNALPSIQVKVASSRLRPSRNSILGLKMPEETSVFSLSVFERATASELWRVEKFASSLPNLEQQLRPRCADLPKLPDRRLFSGHSPAVVDARRGSINAYFEDLLDTPMDEQAAAIICRFLSTDVMDQQLSIPIQNGEDIPAKPVAQSLSGIPTKSGYLTKKGKNFGGWKARYFVLDSPELRYFEAPGGAHLGTIKLLNARIGRQTQTDPASHAEVENENQYRHAFLILEPKRKDMNSHVRHVLCAESDAERDEWVETLLHYIDERPAESRSQYGAGVHSSHTKEVKGAQRIGFEDTESKSTGSPQFNQGHSDTPSPSNASSHTPEFNPEPAAMSKMFNISGPMNGTVISDAGLWGNKPTTSGGSKEREQKKRNLFHFKKPSNEQLAPVQPAQPKRSDFHAHRGGHVRPVFGMQLQEAVEYYSPVDVDVNLPAVVYRCIEYLRVKKAANEEGLFRLSGSNIVIRQLKDRFNMEGDVDLLAQDGEEYDVHAIASLFKTYLRELPSSILTRELHLEFLKVLELSDKAQKITAFNVLVHQLPGVNFSLLRTLSQYLLEVVQNSDRNKMSVKNVGIVFSPTLNIPAPVFAMFLTDFEAIFDRVSDEESIRSIELERDGALTPEDIRSPRRQMFTDLPTPAYNQNSFAHNTRVTGATQTNEKPLDYLDPASDFGFAPIQTSYETRSYVSIPHEMPTQPRYPPPPAPMAGNKYGGMHNMLSPENVASVKAKRRESSMLFL